MNDQTGSVNGRIIPGFDTPNNIRELILKYHNMGNYKLSIELSFLYECFTAEFSGDPNQVKETHEKLISYHDVTEKEEMIF